MSHPVVTQWNHKLGAVADLRVSYMGLLEAQSLQFR